MSSSRDELFSPDFNFALQLSSGQLLIQEAVHTRGAGERAAALPGPMTDEGAAHSTV